MNSDESARLMSQFTRWLVGALVSAFGAVLIALAVSGLVHPLPAAAVAGLAAFVLLAGLVPTGIAARYLLAASRVRAGEYAAAPGLAGFLGRHAVAVGVVCMILVLALVIVFRRS